MTELEIKQVELEKELLAVKKEIADNKFKKFFMHLSNEDYYYLKERAYEMRVHMAVYIRSLIDADRSKQLKVKRNAK